MLNIASRNRTAVERRIARLIDMLAMLLTFAFLTTAALATAVIASSLAKGFAAASSLLKQLAVCDDTRTVVVRHERLAVSRAIIPARLSHRPIRTALLHASKQRAAA